MEKFILKSLLLGSLALVAVSCAKKEADESEGIDPYVVVSGTLTQSDQTAVSGDAVLRFQTSLPGITSGSAIQIKGLLGPSGYVGVVFNSDEMTLGDSKGIIFKLVRSSDVLSTSCTASVTVQGNSVAVANQRLSYFNCFDFEIIVEVHNTPTSTRLLVWRKELATYSIANAEIDSATPSHFQGIYPSGGGQGIFAGLKLHGASLTTARVIEAKVKIP